LANQKNNLIYAKTTRNAVPSNSLPTLLMSIRLFIVCSLHDLNSPFAKKIQFAKINSPTFYFIMLVVGTGVGID
jgi:hypothetical protein